MIRGYKKLKVKKQKGPGGPGGTRGRRARRPRSQEMGARRPGSHQVEFRPSPLFYQANKPLDRFWQ